ncbi:hypothetical protein [Candidatus Poriferisocius sp.]|uniref:hypothetical protein n=1 Tax=Candidatus Poriferisocius sp. TaxID=3101276 RepID=UPI003B01EAB8
MSREQRSIRPYRIDPRLDGLFADSVLQFGSQQCTAGGSVSVRDDFQQCAVILNWMPSGQHVHFVRRLREGVIRTGLRLEDTCVVVAARSGYLKLSGVVFRHSLANPSELSPEPRLDLAQAGGRPEIFRCATHGVTIDAYIALVKTLPQERRKALAPWRVGTWLAHVRFRVKTMDDAELFRPQLLNEQKRSELGLPDGTVTYAVFDGNVTDADRESADVCTFWVDEELLRTIDTQSGSAEADMLQRWLFVEFISAVLNKCRTELGGSAEIRLDDLRESLFGRILRMLAGSRASDDELNMLARDCVDDPSKAIATAQDQFKLRKAAISSLKSGQN